MIVVQQIYSLVELAMELVVEGNFLARDNPTSG